MRAKTKQVRIAKNRIESERERYIYKEYKALDLESEYASCGITVVNHIIAFDEFWWNGEDIGSNDADQVVYYFKKTGRVPESIEEAYTITLFRYTDGGNII